jgi:hypothetical protein
MSKRVLGLLGASVMVVSVCFAGTAEAAEVSRYAFRGPSASAEFQRVTSLLCTDGSLSSKVDTISVSVANFRERIDGEPVRPGPMGFVTIFSLDGCTGELSAGSADISGLRYHQADVARARIAGRAEVSDFMTGEPMGSVVMDFVLDGVGPIKSSVEHTTTRERGVYRTTEISIGRARDSRFSSGTVTVDGASVAASFVAPLNSLLNGFFSSTTVTF